MRAIGETPLFAALAKEDLRAIAERVTERRLRPGEVLFAEGDKCAGLHVLIAGNVKICITSSCGRELMLAIESAPGTIAELPLFDGEPYPATAFAVDEVSALVIRCEDFHALCLEHPEVPIRLLSVVGRRVRDIVGIIDKVVFGGVRQRLARAILDLRDEAGDDTFVLPTSLQELAHRLGTAREVVSRNMSRFQARGLLRLNRRQVVILDKPGLLREAEPDV